MQIDPQELHHVAAAEAARFDLYALIHKALRAFMADSLLAVGRMDAADELELARCTEQVLQLLALCRSHLAHENAFVHGAIEARAPGASERIAHEHEEHEANITELVTLVAALRGAPALARADAARGLYRALALFVAGNLGHMHVEETTHNAVLWARYTDAELVALHDALVASIPPEEMMLIARWMVPFMNPQERAQVLGDMKAKAPAAAFEALLAAVRPHLTGVEWHKLARSLGLAAATAGGGM